MNFKLLVRMIFGAIVIFGACGVSTAQTQPLEIRFRGSGTFSLAEAPASSSLVGEHTQTKASDGSNVFPDSPPEIALIARGLGAQDFLDGKIEKSEFVGDVYEYVLKNINTEFRFGLGKGGFGALVDQSGTASDQAHLMSLLLKEGGVIATFKYGVAEVSGSDFGRWTGFYYDITPSGDLLVNASAACLFLSKAGIPVEINGGFSRPCDFSGDVNSVSIGHVWVDVDGEIYDPSFKPKKIWGASALHGLMGCSDTSQCSLAADLKNIATQTADHFNRNGILSMKNVKKVQLEASLKSRAVNLITEIRALEASKQHRLEVEDLVGGNQIDFSYLDKYRSSFKPIYGDVFSSGLKFPDRFRTKVVFNETTAGQLGVKFYLDEIYGAHLSFYSNSGLKIYRRYGTNDYLRTISKSARGGQITVEVNNRYTDQYSNYKPTYVTDQINLRYLVEERSPEVYRSFPDQGTDFISRMHTRIGGPVVPVFMVGRATPARSAYFRGLISEIDSEGANVDEAEILPSLYFEQLTQATMLLEGITKTSIHNYGIFGWSDVRGSGLYNANFVGGEPTALPEWGFTRQNLSLEQTLSAIPKNSGASNEIGLRMAFAYVANILESSILNQTQDQWGARSAISTFVDANAGGYEYTKATADNLEDILANLGRISTDWVKTNGEDYTKGEGEALVESQKDEMRFYFKPNSDSIGILLNRSVVGDIDYRGVDDYNLLSPVAPIFSFGNNNKNNFSFVYGANKGAFSGGDVAKLNNIIETTVPKSIESIASVGLSDGSVSLSPQPDLVTGYGEYPFSLSFKRFYNSKRDNIANYGFAKTIAGGQAPSFTEDDKNRLLPSGWTHNFDMSATITHEGHRALGTNNAVDAVSSLVSLYALTELLRDGGDFDAQVTSLFVANWFGDSLLKNGVVLKNGHSARSFLRLPDNTFNPVLGDTGKLTVTGWPTQIDQFKKVRALTWENYQDVLIQLEELTREKTFYGSSTYKPQDCNGYKYSGISGRCFKSNKYYATKMSYPNGINLDLTYETVNFNGETMGGGHNNYQTIAQRQRLSLVKNSLGRELNFTFNTYSVGDDYTERATISDETGREVKIFGKRSGAQAFGSEHKVALPNGDTYLYGFDDITTPVEVNGNGLRVKYNSESYRLPPIKELFLPDDLENSVEVFEYNQLHQIIRKTDASGQSVEYALGGLGSMNEELTISRQTDGLGNTTKTHFDEDGRPIMIIEPAYQGVGQ